MHRKTLVVSTFNYSRRAYNGVCYEFSEAIRQLEAADVIAPPAVVSTLPFNSSLFGAVRDRKIALRALVRDIYLMQRGGLFERSRVDEDYDVCFFMCQFLRELHNIDRVQNWRKRSRRAVAFILESWSSTLPQMRAQLRLLDRFDHVFVLNADSIPAMQRHTRTPISFLPTGADCLAGTPSQMPALRPVDVLCFGRRVPAVHDRMLALARERGWFYLFDIWSGIQAADWAQARAANADMVRRSRYCIAWDPSMESTRGALIGSDRALTTRYFEAAAGGAIILGSRTPGKVFDDSFDWPDAVVEIARDGSDLEARIDALEADPVRSAAIRRTGMVQSLRRHDWAYRWDRVLDTLDLRRTAAHDQRVARLHERARMLEGAPGPGSARRAEPPGAPAMGLRPALRPEPAGTRAATQAAGLGLAEAAAVLGGSMPEAAPSGLAAT
jgi:hypothetical protein